MIWGMLIGIFIGSLLFGGKCDNNSTIERCKSPTYERPKRLNQ